jgi:hypothetical protein
MPREVMLKNGYTLMFLNQASMDTDIMIAYVTHEVEEESGENEREVRKQQECQS